ncbi:MAG: outer membrane lipoprotein carrier protein LolA [Dehalococcoidia bacterium]
MSADRYGFRPMPDEGLTIRQKLAILAVAIITVVTSMTIAFSCQLSAETNRYDRLWSAKWQWPERYHLLAANEDADAWEIWFEAPNRWLVKQPGGFQVSDGTTVSTYVADGNFYSRNPVNQTYIDVGIGPLGPRDPQELKRLLRSAEDIGSGWSVENGTYLGQDIDIVQMGRATVGKNGIVRTLIVDPKRMVLLREALSDLDGNETYIEATSVEYDVTAPDGTFVFSPPEGSCLKASSTAPCRP